MLKKRNLILIIFFLITVIFSYTSIIFCSNKYTKEENNKVIKNHTIKTHSWYNTGHHNLDGGFINPWEKEFESPGFKGFMWVMGKLFKFIDYPKTPSVEINKKILFSKNPEFKIFWIGHATTLIKLGDLYIITDPVFSLTAGPTSFTGTSRKTPPAIEISNLPDIDIVLISHNHYDHLDKSSILEIKEKFNPLFMVPLNVKETLLDWDITNVIELDWYQYIEYNNLQINCTPAKHFSQRSIADRDETLWASWYVKSINSKYSFFFAGDTAYSPHFKEIGEKLGAPTAALMPIGAYKPRWFMSRVHVNPQEALQGFLDMKAENFIAIHWGTFALADEPFHEPMKETTKIAKEMQISAEKIHILPIGGYFSVDGKNE
ncbi:MAG: MBL fold metallo-hydrolase [Spirochaetia bacterium]|nr:MBL fold metallo-hydrolase [Spirochaetia bacterium]